MTQHASSKLLSRTKQSIVMGSLVGATAVAVVVAGIIFFKGADSGNQIIRNGNVDDTREALKILVDSYSTLAALATTAFGAVAFLVTFQDNRQKSISTRAWSLLSVGIILLAGALILSFVGRELLLTMVSQNAVDVTLPILRFGRWATYACLVLAAIFIAYFALEVAVSPKSGEK